MPGKQRYIRSIDLPLAGSFDAGGDVAGTGVAAVAPPAIATPGAPTNLALTTANERNASTPTSLIAATWYPPPGVAPQGYVIQWSTNSAFPDGVTPGLVATAESATIGGLIPNTLYYVRVSATVAGIAGAWSTTASITTAADTTPPAVVTSPAASFAGGGDLVVTWVNPTSANFRRAEIKIYDGVAHTNLWATIYDSTQRFVWTVAANLLATSGAGDPTLSVDIRAQSWGGIFSSIATASLATKLAPAAPTVTLVGGYSILLATVTSAPESPYSLFEYVWKRDTITQRTDLVADTSKSYGAGAAGDEGSHSWTVVVRQRDAFGQYSSTTTPSAVVLDTLTISYLRAGAFYTDSDANTYIPPNSGTLAALKDGVNTSGGVSYAA